MKIRPGLLAVVTLSSFSWKNHANCVVIEVRGKYALASVDCTDICINKNIPYSAVWYFSHKFRLPGFRCEAVLLIPNSSIRGDNGPLATGLHPDIQILKCALRGTRHCDEHRKSDSRYSGPSCCTPCSVND